VGTDDFATSIGSKEEVPFFFLSRIPQGIVNFKLSSVKYCRIHNTNVAVLFILNLKNNVIFKI
jgi:hypothetical protein